MIRRPSGRLRRDPVKSQRCQIEFIDKDVDHLNGIVLVNPVSKALGKQRCLTTIRTLNKALHPIPRRAPAKSLRENHMKQRVFTQPGSFTNGCIRYTCRSMSVVTPIATFGRAPSSNGDARRPARLEFVLSISATSLGRTICNSFYSERLEAESGHGVLGLSPGRGARFLRRPTR